MAEIDKTVFILGAGFSKSAGFPLQAEILARVPVVKLDGASEQTLAEYYKAVSKVGEFLSKAFPVDPSDFRIGNSEISSATGMPALEDVFTLLDSTIARREHSYGLSREQLETTREAIKKAILFVIHHSGAVIDTPSENFYRRIAASIIDLRTKNGQPSDTMSVITLNWDTLLEDSVYRCILEKGLATKIDIDYCCYTNPYRDDCPHTPSLLQKAKGIYNIKVLKLHGSTNWLRCPSCNRLFTGIGGPNEEWVHYISPGRCQVCSKRDSQDSRPILEPFFVTPTFLKVFDNPHIQTVWQNAFVELSEATRIVFIGYSLPEADYHFRTVIRRAVHPDAEITAFLMDNDFPKRNTPKHLRHAFAAWRYRQFFGDDRVDLRTGGVKEFADEFAPDENIGRVLRRTSDRIRRAMIQ